MAAVELTYLGCAAATGAVVEELPLTPAQPLGRRIGGSSSTSFDLALAGAPAEWEAACEPGATMIVAVDRLTSLPIWSGLVLPRAGGSASTATLSAATPEAYLDRRYPGDQSFTGVDISLIMQQIATPAATQGPPITLDVTPCGISADYAVADSDNKSILACLQELSALAGAPEWTIDTTWADATQSAVQLVLRIRPTIGVQSATPEAAFDLPGCISAYELQESYESGKGATSVTAWGDTEGAALVTSPPQLATALLAAGWLLWEHRYQPSTGITAPDQLAAHAAAQLAVMAAGARAWTLTATASRSPRLGLDWALGDSLQITITSSPRHPAGVTTVARAYGWSLNPGTDTVAPILLED